METVTIEDLHERTRYWVRRAENSGTAIAVTHDGKAVAVLANASLIKHVRRKRTLLPEHEILMAQAPGNDLVKDLDNVRGDR